ncbi:MAG: hypothetical protein COV52_01745 [Gammaproteobacteria bacterium CG11_big_fil_rev_8_21_14_0_20_46_22]|nr:MAG: hypothetical protein COW05_05640 [Gammaproteobacteria bacterium CG12_big_fil_rev_8_21_14_0_65_46_12]PIR11837.1 MAG: hypothetical protein COV52_01745 [Gammaproteobacteria bacterium CG11_big_fil_rev_8_21_14_0_20_46_22]
MTKYAFQQAHTVSDVLTRLLKEHKITSAKLAERISTPRATITNIAKGRTTDPRISTLEAIASYFDISVDQLLGKETISQQNIADTVTQRLIPVITWEKATQWQQIIEDATLQETSEKIPVDAELEKNQFALKVSGDAMWPQFQEDGILIVDPEKPAKNRDFVVAHIHKTNETILRQLYTEGQKQILKAANSAFPSITMNDSDTIVGVVVQTRNEYD